jgi:hypothetical protein
LNYFFHQKIPYIPNRATYTPLMESHHESHHALQPTTTATISPLPHLYLFLLTIFISNFFELFFPPKNTLYSPTPIAIHQSNGISISSYRLGYIKNTPLWRRHLILLIKSGIVSRTVGWVQFTITPSHKCSQRNNGVGTIYHHTITQVQSAQ